MGSSSLTRDSLGLQVLERFSHLQDICERTLEILGQATKALLDLPATEAQYEPHGVFVLGAQSYAEIS